MKQIVLFLLVILVLFSALIEAHEAPKKPFKRPPFEGTRFTDAVKSRIHDKLNKIQHSAPASADGRRPREGNHDKEKKKADITERLERLKERKRQMTEAAKAGGINLEEVSSRKQKNIPKPASEEEK
eukprot:TRINITY_DN17961_c0_g1::TRINITY_DN17961_c0_g1_i1::g.11452::m.11452 TRINITY_DN17961_c0_g1::TRINITY_DN17961_c0_g1_i1::g.11452  ORF type:complete len:127 (+),score=4.29 TRINITY_DN17961_c0_g1_i1:56-436(+)